VKIILFDSNIYDELEKDVSIQIRLHRLIQDNVVRVIATPKIQDELGKKFGGVPAWFPINLENESVFVFGHSRLDRADMRQGEVFEQHRGSSKKIADAMIADSADALADVLVSDDKRCRDRLKKISNRCSGMTYKEFTAWLEHL
jgi:hypothetical protein